VDALREMSQSVCLPVNPIMTVLPRCIVIPETILIIPAASP